MWAQRELMKTHAEIMELKSESSTVTSTGPHLIFWSHCLHPLENILLGSPYPSSCTFLKLSTPDPLIPLPAFSWNYLPLIPQSALSWSCPSLILWSHCLPSWNCLALILYFPQSLDTSTCILFWSSDPTAFFWNCPPLISACFLLKLSNFEPQILLPAFTWKYPLLILWSHCLHSLATALFWSSSNTLIPLHSFKTVLLWYLCLHSPDTVLFSFPDTFS